LKETAIYPVLVLLSVLLPAIPITVLAAPAATPKAIFVILDGIPADVIERTATPYLDEISGEHGYTRTYTGGIKGEVSESLTISATGYNNLLTGTWSNKHNVLSNDINNPNYDYWDIFRIAKAHNPALHTAIFSTWTDNRTKLLGDGLEQAGGKKFNYSFDGFELDEEEFPHDLKSLYIRNIDEHVTAGAVRYISDVGPDLSWVYLQYTDDIGHWFGDSPELTAAVQLMDDRVGRIWRAVQNRSKETGEDWLMIVTTDHGRDAASGRHHGDQSDRERTTWMATNSDRLNARYAQLPAAVDLLPSLASHLQLSIPAAIAEQLDGQSFINPAGTTPAAVID
jgi:predicted AlkP superfamily pyrophosphatase or phosphodiesterase